MGLRNDAARVGGSELARRFAYLDRSVVATVSRLEIQRAGNDRAVYRTVDHYAAYLGIMGKCEQ